MYITTNPCLCQCTVSEPCHPSQCGGGDCFCMCNIYISPKSDVAVAPCGDVGTILLTDYQHDFTVCGENTVLFEVMFFDQEFFTDAQVSPAGNLTWSINAGQTKYTGLIQMKASCGERGKYFTVQIGKKDLCSLVSCQEGFKCDECTGNCIEIDAPLSGSGVLNSTTIVITESVPVEYNLIGGRWIRDILVEYSVDQTVKVGLTPGGSEIAEADLFIADGNWATLGGTYFNDNDTTIYFTAVDARFTLDLD